MSEGEGHQMQLEQRQQEEEAMEAQHLYYRQLEADKRAITEHERASFLARNPGYEFCLKHPERPVVDSGVCTKRHCAECIEDNAARHLDARIKQDVGGMSDPRNWRADHDMRYYSDASTPQQEPKGIWK